MCIEIAPWEKYNKIMVSECNFKIKSCMYDAMFPCLYSQLFIQSGRTTKNQHTYVDSKLMPLIEMWVFNTIITLKAVLGLLPSSKAKGKHMYGTSFCCLQVNVQ